jgi:hypothetical protein
VAAIVGPVYIKYNDTSKVRCLPSAVVHHQALALAGPIDVLASVASCQSNAGLSAHASNMMQDTHFRRMTQAKDALQVCYASAYTGPDRGVLITLAQQQFGHFPLGLMEAGKSSNVT